MTIGQWPNLARDGAAERRRIFRPERQDAVQLWPGRIIVGIGRVLEVAAHRIPPDFFRAGPSDCDTGHKVQTDFAVIAVSKRKIDAGATFDIAVLQLYCLSFCPRFMAKI
jgi:hypothetical protein